MAKRISDKKFGMNLAGCTSSRNLLTALVKKIAYSADNLQIDYHDGTCMGHQLPHVTNVRDEAEDSADTLRVWDPCREVPTIAFY